MSTVNTKYLVFEDTQTVMDMNKISVFANGSEMPWTYYQADMIEADGGTTSSGGGKRFMWTSESKESSPGSGDAGKYVSEIKRKIKLGNNYVDEVVKNPNLSDYKTWGWPLSKDSQGNEILPQYGEFAFRPNFAPSFEDASSILIDFKFGFGLNNTCYNFADERAEVAVYNLSSAPDFYITDNPTCNPIYQNGSWNSDMIPIGADGILNGKISEGSDSDGNLFKKYLLVRVESGEFLRINSVGDSYGELQMTIDGTTYNDSGITNINAMTPYKMNVSGEKTSGVINNNIKYDFFKFDLQLTSASQTLAYLSNLVQRLNLTFTPVAYGTELKSFTRQAVIKLTVSKKVDLPYIRDDLTELTHGFRDTLSTRTFDTYNEALSLADTSNFRLRNIITSEEAIGYAVNNNIGPSFCRNKTVAEALYTYRRSLLTETEKNLDDYKRTFTDIEKMRKLCYYIAQDMSAHVLENFSSFDVSEGGLGEDDNLVQSNDLSGALDLSNVYNGFNGNTDNFFTEINNFREAIDTELVQKSKTVSYINVKTNTSCSARLEALVNKFKVERFDVSGRGLDAGYKQRDFSGIPHMDSRMDFPRKFGELLDVSMGEFKDSSGRYSDATSRNRIRNSLLGQQSTLLTLLYALYNDKTEGNDELISKYRSKMSHTKGNTKIKQLVEAMRDEYNPDRTNDISGNSQSRPIGFKADLDQFRHEINPVNGQLAIQYLTKVMKIVDISNNGLSDRIFYGTDSIYKSKNLTPKNPNTTDVKALLFKGGVSKQIIGRNKLINLSTLDAVEEEENPKHAFRLANPILMNFNDTEASDVSYIHSVIHDYDGNPIANPGYKLDIYDNSDQSSVFYTLKDGDDNYVGTGTNDNPDSFREGSFPQNRGYLGDCSGWVTSFIKMGNDKTTSSFANQWIYTTDHRDSSAGSPYYTSGRTGYTDTYRHSENIDFSGIIKIHSLTNGNYTDVYIGGQELKETVIDIETEMDLATRWSRPNGAVDLSALPRFPNNVIPTEVANNRKDLIKTINCDLNTLTVGGYQFYRIGGVIRVIANKDDLDADAGIDGGLPEITFKTRGDTDGSCDKSYKLYVYPKDISSNLRIQMAPWREWAFGIDASGIYSGSTATTGDFNPDTSGVWTSRWSKSTIPIDVSGTLEKGEKFQFHYESDRWFSSDSVFVTPADASNGDLIPRVFRTDFATSGTSIPDDCKELEFKVEYKFLGGEWKDVSGVTFEYECHNKTAADSYADAIINARNSGGVRYSNLETGGDLTKYEEEYGVTTLSSNIKGYPIFRAVLSSQSKLLQRYYSSAQNSINTTITGGAISNFGTVGREMKLVLKYVHNTAKASFDQDTFIRTYVGSDAYDANVKVRELGWSYDKDELKLYEGKLYKFGKANNSFTQSASGGLLPGVAANTLPVVYWTVKDGASNQGKIPDYSKMISNLDFDQTWYRQPTIRDDGTVSREGELVTRDTSGMPIKVVEGVFGKSNPIAEISFDQYIKSDGAYGASVDVIPLFRYESDYNQWAMNGTFSDINNSADAASDYSNNAPRLIPANINYDVYYSSDRTKAYLYRKLPFNYEEWIGSSGNQYSSSGFFRPGDADASGQAYHELVSVRVNYTVPTSESSGYISNYQSTKTILFYVQPQDKMELKWADNFTVNVDEGDSYADVTTILSATLEGKTENIKYVIAGYIDGSGLIRTHPTGFSQALEAWGTDVSANFDMSNVRDMSGDIINSTADGSVTGLILDPTNTKDLVHKDYEGVDLATKSIGGILKFYHKNHNSIDSAGTNTKFDSYAKKSYKILIGASFEKNDQSGIERKLALLNINVRDSPTGFYIGADKSSIVKVTETLGTVAEGFSALQNNPELQISDKIISQITHEDLTAAQLLDVSRVKFSLAYIDPDLEVCPPTGAAGTDSILKFEQQVIKLKDIPENKTTETATAPSTSLARYAHYNYERKKEYQVHVCAELTNMVEIEVAEAPTNYLCGQKLDAGAEGNLNTVTAGKKTTDFVMLATKADGTSQTDPRVTTDTNGINMAEGEDDKARSLYYFKHPTTKKYVGPLSTAPSTLEDMKAFRVINGVRVKYAYVRFQQLRSNNQGEAGTVTSTTKPDYTPLYKAAGFRDDMEKPPKPADSCLLIFTIRVLNTFDKAKTSPQPYELVGIKDYKYSDPNELKLLDSETITVEEGAKHICYVYGDHKELNSSAKRDHGNDAVIPAWHPHHLLPSDAQYVNGFTGSSGTKKYPENKLGNGTFRKIHPRAKCTSTNENDRTLAGTNGQANNSVRIW